MLLSCAVGRENAQNVRENIVGAAHPNLVLVGLWSPQWCLTHPIGKQDPPSDAACPHSSHHKPSFRQELGTAGTRKVFGDFLSGIYPLSLMPIQVLLLPEGSSHSIPPHRTGNAERDPHVPVGRARATSPPLVAFPRGPGRYPWCVGRTGTGILGGGNGAVLPTPGRRDFCRNKLNPPD